MKNMKVDDETWKKLNQIKYSEGFATLSEVIQKMEEVYAKRDSSAAEERSNGDDK